MLAGDFAKPDREASRKLWVARASALTHVRLFGFSDSF
jgi:hypothetical protein